MRLDGVVRLVPVLARQAGVYIQRRSLDVHSSSVILKPSSLTEKTPRAKLLTLSWPTAARAGTGN